MGGTDNPDNLIRVNTKMHAFLHKQLWEEYGCIEDKMAWLGLSGQMPFREIDEHVERLRREKISKWHKGKIVSEITRQKISQNCIERYSTPEGKAHLVKHCRNRLGKKASDDTKRKQSKALKGRIFSEESRKKMSDAKNGKNHPKYGQTTYQLTDPEGNIFIVSGGFTQWCKDMKLNGSLIRKVALGELNHHKKWTAKIMKDGKESYSNS